MVAAAAAAVAQAQNTNVSFRMMTWSDAESIRQKVELAKRLGVRGVSVFKIDGGYDPGLWEVLK
jgi:spore germination protein YaaH